MQLIKKLLLQIEEAEQVLTLNDFLVNSDHGTELINYHLMLLKEAGLIEGLSSDTKDGAWFLSIQKLTWKGHEFLDKAKNESAWKKTMSELKKEGFSASFGIVSKVLEKVIEKQFEKLIGDDIDYEA